MPAVPGSRGSDGTGRTFRVARGADYKKVEPVSASAKPLPAVVLRASCLKRKKKVTFAVDTKFADYSKSDAFQAAQHFEGWRIGAWGKKLDFTVLRACRCGSVLCGGWWVLVVVAVVGARGGGG